MSENYRNNKINMTYNNEPNNSRSPPNISPQNKQADKLIVAAADIQRSISMNQDY